MISCVVTIRAWWYVTYYGDWSKPDYAKALGEEGGLWLAMYRLVFLSFGSVGMAIILSEIAIFIYFFSFFFFFCFEIKIKKPFF